MHAARASRDASNLRDASDRRYRPRGPPPAVDVLSCLISRPFLGASRPCTQRSGLAPLRGYSALKGATARRESSAATAAATPHELPNFVPFACFVVRPDTLRASRSALAPLAPLRGYSALKRSTARRGSSAATAAATPHELLNFVPFACFVVTPTLLAPLAPRLFRSERSTARRGSSAATAAATSHELPNFVPFVCSVVTPTISAPPAPPLRLLRLFAATPL